MKAKELIELTTAEIEQKLAYSIKKSCSTSASNRQPVNWKIPARFRQVRKDIARCKTVIRERELGIERRKQA